MYNVAVSVFTVFTDILQFPSISTFPIPTDDQKTEA